MNVSPLNPRVSHFDQVDCTNTKLREMTDLGATEGVVIVAGSQTAGRGTDQRSWHSPVGGMYLSALLRARELVRVTDLSLLAGATLAEAVGVLLPKSKEVSVKWPNDCLVGWKKVGGVLCEVYKESEHPLVIVGIGLNVNIPPEELQPFEKNPFSVTTLMTEKGGEAFDLGHVTGVVIGKLFSLYASYQQRGFGAVKQIWEQNCRLLGKKIEVSELGWEGKQESAKEQRVEGIFEGIDEEGALVLLDEAGGRKRYYSGRITCFWP